MSFMWMWNAMTSNVTTPPSFETQTPGLICTDQNMETGCLVGNVEIIKSSIFKNHLNSTQEKILVK